jgi:Short C-terminal domain/Phospholipase_D-nuclease N-terminal
VTHNAVVLAAQDYPALNLFWSILEVFLWIMWFFLLFRIIGDIFRSSDLSGWGKAGWSLFVIILPFLGVLLYLIVRGSTMHERDAAQAQAADAAFRSYIKQSAGTTSSTAEELTKLADLHDHGVLTDAEFLQQKAKLLA